MKIRTQEMLSDHLSGDLAWRKKELTDIRQLLQQKRDSSQRRRVLERAGIALLYAHFEGFTKQAGRAYLEYVAAQRLSNDQIARNLLALSISDELAAASASRKPSNYSRTVSLLLDSGTSRAKIPYKTAIDTESNLSSRVLREIAWTIGIDYSVYEAKEKLIDSRLLARRNHIAHGEQLNLDDGDYDELHVNVIQILETFRNQIENAAATRLYARSV